MRGIANITLMALLTTAAGCTRPVAIDGKEVAREIDFYSELKALVTKDSAGAPKSDVYRVYVAPIDHEEGAKEIFRTNDARGPTRGVRVIYRVAARGRSPASASRNDSSSRTAKPLTDDRIMTLTPRLRTPRLVAGFNYAPPTGAGSRHDNRRFPR
jgi:hypothetical protein